MVAKTKIEKLKRWISLSPLKAHRLNMGLTCAEISILCGVSRVTWVAWEKGNTSPKDENLRKIDKMIGGVKGGFVVLDYLKWHERKPNGI